MSDPVDGAIGRFPADDLRLEAVADGTVPTSELTPDEARLRSLLTAAASPATPAEVAGEAAVVAAFRTASRAAAIDATAIDATAIDATAAASAASDATVVRLTGVAGDAGRPAGRHAGTARRAWRPAAAVGLGVAVVLAMGGAAAAMTGVLPPPLQQFVHDSLGAPAPQVESDAPDDSPDDAASAPGRPGASGAVASGRAAPTTPAPSSRSAGPSAAGPTSAGVASPGATGPAAAAARGLCQAWRSGGGGTSTHAAVPRALAGLAGGSDRVADFCAVVLAQRPGSAARPVPPGSGHAAKPSPHASKPARPTKPTKPKPTKPPKPAATGRPGPAGTPSHPTVTKPGRPTAKPTHPATKRPKPSVSRPGSVAPDADLSGPGPAKPSKPSRTAAPRTAVPSTTAPPTSVPLAGDDAGTPSTLPRSAST